MESSEPREKQGEVRSAVDFDTTSAIQELKARQRRVERFALFGSGVFLVALIGAVVLSYSGALQGAWDFVTSFEKDGNASRNVAANCQDPRNRNTPYCVESAWRTESNWRSIERGGGKANAFSLGRH